MIRESIAKFLSDQVPDLGGRAYVTDPKFVVSEHQKPMVTVAYLSKGEALWEIGDRFRQDLTKVQLTLYSPDNDYAKHRDLEARILTLLQNASTTNEQGHLVKGIPFMAVGDLLKDAGDHLNYLSDQPNWMINPAPVVFKNGTVVNAGYTVDFANGKVIFTNPQNPNDRIQATYKVSVVDFVIEDMARPQIIDLANVKHFYNTAWTLGAFWHLKAVANKLY